MSHLRFFRYDGHAVNLWWKSTRGVANDEPHSDSQGSNREVWARRRDSEKAYQDEHNCKSEFVFSTTKHPLSYREVNLLLRRYCKRLDILYRSSHKSRKTYISSLIDAGININSVRSYAGHADERTTYSCYCYDRTPERFKKEQLERALSLEWKCNQKWENVTKKERFFPVIKAHSENDIVWKPWK